MCANKQKIIAISVFLSMWGVTKVKKVEKFILFLCASLHISAEIRYRDIYFLL